MMSALPDTEYSAIPVGRRPWPGVIALVAAMTVLRIIYASLIELRTDEAYYWTWSKESVLSFLDHPPMIAWFIRFGTSIFGDTNLGVRFAGIVAMLVMQLLLADIVRRVTRDTRAMVLAVLMPEAALYYGLLMAKVSPDVAMIPFAVAMLWALVRLSESGEPRWWLWPACSAAWRCCRNSPWCCGCRRCWRFCWCRPGAGAGSPVRIHGWRY